MGLGRESLPPPIYRSQPIMAKRFTCRNLKDGYAAIGNSLRRPRYPSAKNRSVAESIASARDTAIRMAKAQGKKKG